VPKDFIEDNFKYIGVAVTGLGFIIFILLCIIICKCCSNKSKRKNKKKSKLQKNQALDEVEKEKDQSAVTANAVPKYMQIGTPTPKSNGVTNTTAPPISVIEASPYRSNPTGSAHPNPDLISDSPVEERVKPKKKVSILGVEEVDANGIVTTRKLDDIAEEYDDSNNYAPPMFDQPIPTTANDFESLDTMNPYSNISTCRIIATINPYPLIDIPSDDFTRQNSSIASHPCEPINYQSEGGMRFHKDDSWLMQAGTYSHPAKGNQVPTPAYATIRRNNLSSSSSNLPINNHIMQDRKFPEEYQLQSTNPVYQAPDGRYVQNYGLVVEKYVSDGTTPTTASTSLTGCDCCPDQKTCGMTDSDGGRMSGDGCSFDNILSSCNSGGVSGAQVCCYPPETNITVAEGRRMFDNSLPHNYSTMDGVLTENGMYESGPLPPEGWRDSDCTGPIMEDCSIRDNNVTPWDSMPLSPGTRILYSPEDTIGMNGKSDHKQAVQAVEIVPPSTQV